MSCKHSNRSSLIDNFCIRCGCFVSKRCIKALREVQFFCPLQASPSEILSNLRESQKCICISNPSYLSKRQQIVEWIIDLCESLNLRNLTCHSSIYLLDYTQSITHMPDTLFEPTALVCLLICSKREESENIPSIKDFSHLTEVNLKPLELDVLAVLGWNLHIVTPLHFVEFYSNAGFVFEGEVEDMRAVRVARQGAELVCELCVSDERFLGWGAEELAACCVAIGRGMAGIKEKWSREVQEIAGFRVDMKRVEEVWGVYKENFPE